jgi:conserved hypothetical protein
MGNTNNVVFLKSTEVETLEMLQKMSGVTHRSYIESKTVTKDNQRLFMQNEGKTSYTMSTKEEPLISMNDMLSIPPRNSIVLMAGDSPVWNRNEMILPMSWKLHADTIRQPGKEYTFQTLPTLSNAKDFDVRQNQPDYFKMVAKRMRQALVVKDALGVYKDVMGYDEEQLTKLDPDALSDDVMAIVNDMLRNKDELDKELDEVDAELESAVYPERDDFGYSDVYHEYDDEVDGKFASDATDNKAVLDEYEKVKADEVENTILRYAGGRLSKNMLVNHGSVNHTFDSMFSSVYDKIRGDLMNDSKHFAGQGNNLLSADNSVTYIRSSDVSSTIEAIKKSASNPDTSTYVESTDDVGNAAHNSYEICDEFYEFLVSLDSWSGIANGKFEKTVKEYMIKIEND